MKDCVEMTSSLLLLLACDILHAWSPSCLDVLPLQLSSSWLLSDRRSRSKCSTLTILERGRHHCHDHHSHRRHRHQTARLRTGRSTSGYSHHRHRRQTARLRTGRSFRGQTAGGVGTVRPRLTFPGAAPWQASTL